MKAFLFFAAIVCFNISFAQQKDTITVSSSLSKATVYYGYGAELQHDSRTSLLNGMQIVIIDGLALSPDINTIQIGCPENVAILSYYHRVYTKPQAIIKDPNIKANDTIRLLRKQLAAVKNEYNTNEDILRRISALVEKNFVTDSKREISSAELIRLTEYYSQKVKVLKDRSYELLLKQEDIDGRINAITQRINNTPEADQSDPKTTGQLVLQIMAKGAGAAEFNVAYFTRNAGWIPTYELRTKTLDNTLKLVYKASITQSTGLDWKNVKLSLSTSNPNQGNTLPSLNTQFLQLYVPEIYSAMTKEKYDAPVQLMELSINNQTKSKAASIQQVNTLSAYTVLKESLLNINFEIELPYDIPSDGKSYSVAIKEEKINALFRHYAIPKIDKDAFLIAEITSWDSLGLLPGEANIIMDNVYLGKTFIDPNTTKDTLSLSLGRDKRIAVSRNLVKEFKSKKEKSDTKTELYSYEITVKNNKKQPVEIVLKDQYPISKMKEVEVVLTTSDADKDSETGILTWNIKLKPGESRKVRFSYTVKYPKDKTLMAY